MAPANNPNTSNLKPLTGGGSKVPVVRSRGIPPENRVQFDANAPLPFRTLPRNASFTSINGNRSHEDTESRGKTLPRTHGAGIKGTKSTGSGLLPGPGRDPFGPDGGL